MENETRRPDGEQDIDGDRRKFIKKVSTAAALVPAVTLLVSLQSTPLSAQTGYQGG